MDCVDGRAVVGSRDNQMFDVALESGEVAAITEGHCAEVWGLAMHPVEAIAVTVGDDKVLRCWDMERRVHVVGKRARLAQGARCVEFSGDGRELAVGLKEARRAGGRVGMCVLEYETMEVVQEMEDCEENVATVKWSGDGRHLAAGSWDQRVYLYRRVEGAKAGSGGDGERFRLQYVLSGNSSSVKHVMFSADGTLLMSNSKDTQMLYWEVSTGARITKPSLLRDVEWAQWTCVLGWPVMGIWDPGYDGTDVNAVCAAHGGGTMVLGDDYGMVKLLRYPCPAADGASFVSYGGHSSHVTNVRYSQDDRWVVSTGGADMGVFVWQYHPNVALSAAAASGGTVIDPALSSSSVLHAPASG